MMESGHQQDQNKKIFLLRGFFSIFSIIAITCSLLDGTTNPMWATGDWAFDFFSGFAYFTIQTNILVLFWWLAAIIRRNSPQRLNQIQGKIRGGVCMYISVTFLVFALVLQPGYTPGTSVAVFTNIALHYVLPLAFIIDWLLTERIVYDWNYLYYWVVYPFLYLFSALLYGYFTGIPLYFFLDYAYFPLGVFLGMILGLIVVFLLIGSVVIAAARFIARKK
jgi:hypothetical protein